VQYYDAQQSYLALSPCFLIEDNTLEETLSVDLKRDSIRSEISLRRCNAIYRSVRLREGCGRKFQHWPAHRGSIALLKVAIRNKLRLRAARRARNAAEHSAGDEAGPGSTPPPGTAIAAA